MNAKKIWLLAVWGVVCACAAGADIPPVETGVGKSLVGGAAVFPPGDAWNRDISKDPVDPASAALIARIGAAKRLHADFGTTYQGHPNGIPYVIVAGSQPKVPVTFDYANESDAGPYPVPPDAPIEGGPAASGDRHVLIIDRDNWKLYELYAARPVDGGKSWHAGSGAIFDLRKPSMQRPQGWTSADAAGLPIFPGLVRYDEVMGRKLIPHALRFTVNNTRHAYVAPASHFASNKTDPGLPPLGMRVRLKAGYDISGFAPAARVILAALKSYGMILADNGSDWFLSGAPDPRWNDDDISSIRKVTGDAFEVVKMGPLTTR